MLVFLKFFRLNALAGDSGKKLGWKMGVNGQAITPSAMPFHSSLTRKVAFAPLRHSNAYEILSFVNEKSDL